MRYFLTLLFLLPFLTACNAQRPAVNAPNSTWTHKTEVDALAQQYLKKYKLPAISVAVMEDGKMVYSEGFGKANEAGGEVTGKSIYLLASISKLMGGTLAAKFEAEGKLSDGTPVALDLTRPTRDYIDIPAAGHTHTVEQITAHLGCVPHYGDSSRPRGHFSTAAGAAETLKDDPTLEGCTIGQDYNYSTHAFTYVGAVLEKVTGRPIAQLVEEEIADQFDLPSIKVMYREETLRPNPLRVDAYDGSGKPSEYEENSWKVLGGGIEASPEDIVRFTHLIDSGKLIAPEVRDNRLWSPVAPNSASPYGVSWRLGNMDGTPIVEHSGSAPGAKTHVRIYRPEGKRLIVCVMTNSFRNGNRPSSLVTEIGEVVLR
jgi:CubicO group peptidase (beta-lactamase class C family)